MKRSILLLLALFNAGVYAAQPPFIYLSSPSPSEDDTMSIPTPSEDILFSDEEPLSLSTPTSTPSGFVEGPLTSRGASSSASTPLPHYSSPFGVVPGTPQSPSASSSSGQSSHSSPATSVASFAVPQTPQRMQEFLTPEERREQELVLRAQRAHRRAQDARRLRESGAQAQAALAALQEFSWGRRLFSQRDTSDTE